MAMELLPMIQWLSAALAPVLPFLAGAGKSAAEEAGKQLGESVGEAAGSRLKALWQRLTGRGEASRQLEKVAAEIAADPKDELAVQALPLALRDLFRAQPQLLAEIEPLVRELQAAGSVTSIVAGAGAVVVGRDAGGDVLGAGAVKIGKG